MSNNLYLKHKSGETGKLGTVNFLNIRTLKNCCNNYPKSWTMWLYHRVLSPKDAEWMANRVDPKQIVDHHQTAPGPVWSGSSLFAQTCLSKNLGPLWYLITTQGSLPYFCIKTYIVGIQQVSRCKTKPKKWHVRPAKTQISLGIRPVWSESPLCAQ